MQLIALDIRTLSFITMSIAFLFSIGLYVFGFMQKKFKGFSMIAIASACFGFGMLFLGLRDVLSDFMSIIVGNTLVLAALVFYYESSRRFLGISNKIQLISILAIATLSSTFLYFTYVFPSVNLRIIVISVLASLMSGLSTREFLRKLPDYWRVPRLMLVFVFGIYCVYNFSRVLWTLGEDTIPSFMAASTLHSFAFILIIYLIIGASFGFIWMVSKKLENELTELAHHDQLTGILNRRGVDTLARHEFSKLSRESGELSIIMADIDHFKMVNDRFGHHVGDRVLTGFAQLVSEHLRPYDIFGRIGGEEFIIILPNTTLQEGMMLAERLRSQVESFVFQENKNKIHITASFGVAEYLPEADTVEKLISLADKAMYWAKQMGRNRVAQYAPIVEESVD